MVAQGVSKRRRENEEEESEVQLGLAVWVYQSPSCLAHFISCSGILSGTTSVGEGGGNHKKGAQGNTRGYKLRICPSNGTSVSVASTKAVDEGDENDVEATKEEGRMPSSVEYLK